ncbi:MAG: winged helix-turn-helix transcriptional regulator [Deltaproteobacteria bacterium]|nr:winged helix-turn-helix transcriptional regulator [Deltaproteobacteria bacterium]
MKEFTRVMKAVSDPNRVKIVKMLQHKVMCVCEIREALQVAQPTVSKHLKVLEEAGMVYSRKEGVWVNYHLSGGEISPYVSSLLGNLKHWLDDDAQVSVLVEKLPGIRREDIRGKCRSV